MNVKHLELDIQVLHVVTHNLAQTIAQTAQVVGVTEREVTGSLLRLIRLGKVRSLAGGVIARP